MIQPPCFISADIQPGVATPGSADEDNPSPEDIKLNEEKLVEALSLRIQVPVYGVGTLRRYLEDANWVQDIAYEAFMADRRTLAAGTTSSSIIEDTIELSEGLPADIRGAPVIIHDNQEEQRRETMRLLRDIVNMERDPNNQVNMTLTEAFFTLALTGWDVEAAAIRWESPDIIRCQLNHTFDHLRAKSAAQVDIDERVARFVHFTGRDDWHSVRAFLAAHKHRFMKAVRAWYRSGMPVVRTRGWNDPARLYEGRRVTYNGQPRSAMPSDNDAIPMQIEGDTWAADEASFWQAADPPNYPDFQQPEEPRKTTNRKRGFCFTPEGNAPELGGVMPGHFTIDYLQNGKYRANGFSWQKWFRPELPESDDNKASNPQFSDHKREHIALLGRWIRQEYSRIEGTVKRPRPQEFSKEEKKYLFELCNRHLKKMLDENPGKTRDDFRPLEFRKGATEQLEKDFNEAFEGTKPGSAAEPRRYRKGTALKVKCARMKRFRDAFGFKNAAKGDESDDSSEWSADECSSQPSARVPTAPLTSPSQQTAVASEPSAMLTDSQLEWQRRKRNMAEERSIAGIDTLAFEHRRNVRAQAEQHWIDRGLLLPSEKVIALQIRIILETECVDGKQTAQHAAVVRHLMRNMGMVIPQELHAYGDDDEMELAAESKDDAENDKGEVPVEANLSEQEDDLHDIEDLEFEPEYFDDEFVGFDED